jgi:hypothetical protein
MSCQIKPARRLINERGYIMRIVFEFIKENTIIKINNEGIL